VQARLEDDAQCILVIIGATSDGKKEFVGLTDGVRESALSWKELPLDLKRRGPAFAPSTSSQTGRSASGKPSARSGARCASNPVARRKVYAGSDDHQENAA
jgi:hypothetical protein